MYSVIVHECVSLEPYTILCWLQDPMYVANMAGVDMKGPGARAPQFVTAGPVSAHTCTCISFHFLYPLQHHIIGIIPLFKNFSPSLPVCFSVSPSLTLTFSFNTEIKFEPDV